MKEADRLFSSAVCACCLGMVKRPGGGGGGGTREARMWITVLRAKLPKGNSFLSPGTVENLWQNGEPRRGAAAGGGGGGGGREGS